MRKILTMKKRRIKKSINNEKESSDPRVHFEHLKSSSDYLLEGSIFLIQEKATLQLS